MKFTRLICIYWDGYWSLTNVISFLKISKTLKKILKISAQSGCNSASLASSLDLANPNCYTVSTMCRLVVWLNSVIERIIYFLYTFVNLEYLSKFESNAFSLDSYLLSSMRLRAPFLTFERRFALNLIDRYLVL